MGKTVGAVKRAGCLEPNSPASAYRFAFALALSVPFSGPWRRSFQCGSALLRSPL